MPQRVVIFSRDDELERKASAYCLVMPGPFGHAGNCEGEDGIAREGCVPW
jgi:hypothetical protein